MWVVADDVYEGKSRTGYYILPLTGSGGEEGF